MSSEVLQAFLITLIQVLLPVFLAMAVAWMQAAFLKAKSEINQEQYKLAVELAGKFVLAAEQSGLTGVISQAGEEKKQWAMEQLDAALQAKGIRLDLPLLSAMIEAEVFKAFRQ
jgi:Bacteriophage holin of superfamily 6 (Holin_LLH)